MSDRPKLRKSVRNLKANELEAFRRAFGKTMALKDDRGFTHIAGFHGVPDQYCRHWMEKRLFLPWHRAYLKWLEVHIQDHDDNVTLPWWNWTSQTSHWRGIPTAYTEETAKVDSQDVPNVLREFRVQLNLPVRGSIDRLTFRAPGHPGNLPFPYDTWRDRDPHDPTREIVDMINTQKELVEISNFVDFSNALQDIHDSVHTWVGGSMMNPAFAAFDPIFWAHHCMVDRLWWIWQNRPGSRNVPQSLLDEQLIPFGLSVREVLDIHDLGYEYVGASVSQLTK
ncbi:MAG: tyrosinase family protein [Desulfurellaceae bacterium]|nr:tyrosinase family protein [Desulfurellaceae bacterium]